MVGQTNAATGPRIPRAAVRQTELAAYGERPEAGHFKQHRCFVTLAFTDRNHALVPRLKLQWGIPLAILVTAPWLLLLFAVSALFLAGLGIYGVINYSVVQRHREIGLRIALGAQPADVYRLVLLDGLLPVAAGAVAGLVLAFGLARMVSSLLFQVSPYNPALAAGALCVLLAAGTTACLLPARRAASVDPMGALRME